MAEPALPAHLDSLAATGLHPGQAVAQFELGDYRNFTYLILDWPTRMAAVVDPQKDLSPWRSALDAHGFSLARVLLTHTHHDHVAGVPELTRILPHLPVHAHVEDAHRIPGVPLLQLVSDGDRLGVGSLSVEVLHTPGHSAGECCYLVRADRPYLFTGDTVFIRDCGRTDFPDGSNEQMFASLQRIRKLPPETILMVGHHYAPEIATTLARELRTSPPFRCHSVEELAGLP
jgi:glyoxylase-like metal-dependent hydrolase (beta-lactamase superfamily II)